MASSNPKISCQCGAISFRAPTPKPIRVYCCHCTECQKQSASAFGVSAIFPTQDHWPPLDQLQPHLGLWTRQTDTGNTLQCYFCKQCGVRILHRSISPDGKAKDAVSIKGGCLEGLSLEGVKHIYTRSALVSVPEGSDPGSPGF